jgi:hypothetical protein
VVESYSRVISREGVHVWSAGPVEPAGFMRKGTSKLGLPWIPPKNMSAIHITGMVILRRSLEYVGM